MSNSTVRLVVADGHRLYREAVVRTIDQHPQLEVVGQASDVQTALKELGTLQPEVVVADEGTLGEGPSLLEAIAERGFNTRVLCLTSHLDSGDVVSAMSGGAKGYLTKHADGDTICSAILEVAGGGSALSDEAQEALFSGLRAPVPAADSQLTTRELEILRLVAEGASNADIGRRLDVSAETVKSHLHNAFDKLGVHDRTAAVASAIRNGLID